MYIPDEWVKESVKAAVIAQTKYKNTPIDKPWPDWEKQSEKAKQILIDAQKDIL